MKVSCGTSFVAMALEGVENMLDRHNYFAALCRPIGLRDRDIALVRVDKTRFGWKAFSDCIKLLLFAGISLTLLNKAAPVDAHEAGIGRAQLPALISNGGTLRTFSDATRLDLQTADDYGRFVDPQVTGADRALAIHFLKIMPPGMRGDFVYVSRSGRILSNRLALGFGIRPMSPVIAASLRHSRTSSHQTIRSVPPRPLGPLAYPPTGGSGGAYIRTYSQQGINAMMTYVQPPCDFGLQPGESGNMYINAYDAGGNDIVDAGLGTGQSESTSGGNLGRMVAFTTPYSAGFSGYGWTNQSQTYPCGQPVGIMYGTLPGSLGGGSMLATGVPDYDPWQMYLPPATANWHPASWTYFDTPSSLLQNPTTWNGISSNCSGCSVGRMTTIGQRQLTYNGSCYGYCTSAGADAFWLETVAGQLVSPCQDNGSTSQCTIQYMPSGWSGGENDSGQGKGIGYATNGDSEAVTGINLNNLLNTNVSTRRLPSASSLPVAPPVTCPPDSQGFCSYQTSGVFSGSCVVSGVHPIVYNNYQAVYQIFQSSGPSELIGTYRATTTYQKYGVSCKGTTVWTPGEPRVVFNDINLP